MSAGALIQGTLTIFCCIVDGKLFEEVMVICETFSESNNPEKFFEQFYCNFTAKATTIMMQLGETVFSYLRALVILQIQMFLSQSPKTK